MDRRGILAGLAMVAAAAPARAQGMSARQIGEQFAATLSAHDIDGFAALFAEDYRNHQVSAAAPPPATRLPDKQGTVAFFGGRLKAMPDLKVSIEAIVASDDSVAASFVYEGTQTGPYMGIAPTGKRLRFTSCDIFAVRGGKIAEHWGMGDIAGVLAQLKS